MAYETVTGYCWPQSVAGGERVALHVSSSGVRPVDVEVAHIGATRTVVYSEAGIPAGDHPTPLDAPERGCGWPAASEVAVEPEWPSGYYEVVLTIDVDGTARRTHAFFVVRPDLESTTARMLLALSTNTWHAYNDFGGRNLYTGATSVVDAAPDGARLSLQAARGRPARHLAVSARPAVGESRRLPADEPPVAVRRVGWLAELGVAVRGVGGSGGLRDRRRHQRRPRGASRTARRADSPYGLYLSIGHDEYWSGPMRDTVEGFIGRGGNAAFFSGNTAFWQVRHEDPTGSDGDGPAATMVGYKGFFKRDPVYDTDRQAELTTIWSDHLLERPENHMTGVSFSRGGYHRIGKRVTNGAGGYTLHRPEHWIFDGTGLDYGDLLGAAATIVGYECDGCDFTYRDGSAVSDRRVMEHPPNFEILGSAPAAHFTRTTASRPPAPHEPSEIEFIASRLVRRSLTPASVERIAHGHAILGTYVSPGGGTVITSGSTDWVWGLAERDRHVEQITRNILDRLS